MPDMKLSVDDILNEIELNRAKAENRRPPGDMQHIDDVIREILTHKQEDELRRQNRQLTEKERASLQKEIEVQTKTLTKQFTKLKKAQEKQRGTARPPVSAPPPAPPSPPPMEGDAPPAPPSPIPPASFSKAHIPHVKAEPESISGHFGNFKMEDSSVEEGYAKAQTEISVKNYKDYKSSRNKKVSSFALGRKDGPSLEDGAEATAGGGSDVPSEEPPLREDAFDFSDGEFCSMEQAEQIGEQLRSRQRRLRSALIFLGAVSVNAFFLSFVTISDTSLLLAGRLPVAPFVYSVIHLALLLLAFLAGKGVFQETAEALQNHQSSRHWLILIPAFVCLAVNLVFCVRPSALMTPGVHLFTPAAVLMIFWDTASRYQTAARAVGNFRFASSEGEKYVVATVEDLRVAKSMTKGAVDSEPLLVKNVKTGFIDSFLAHSFCPDASDTAAQRLLLAAIPLSLGLGVLAWFLTKNLFLSLSALSGALVLCGGFLNVLAVSLPLHDTFGLAKRFGGMMPSYDTIEGFKDCNSVLLSAGALFPAGSIVLKGIKTFQDRRVDDVIVDAASTVCAADSALRHVFLEILNNDSRLLRPVDSVQYEDLMGMSAWVNEKRVLIGSRDLMINHSIPVPSKENEAQYRSEGDELVYLATGGELAAVFILEFKVDPTSANMIRLLEKHGVAAIVKTVDSCITSDLLGKLFEVDPALFKLLPSRLHGDYDAETAPCEHSDSMLGNNGSLLGYIVSLAAAKKLSGCIRFGTLLSYISAGCGLLLLAVLLLLNAPAAMGSLQAILFSGVFLMVYWVYEKNMRV